MASINELIEDVVIEILARLSVKSLMRFKCVCKSWYSLIKNPNPDFLAKHLANASSNDESARMIIAHGPWHRVTLHSDETLKSFEKIRLPYTSNREYSPLVIYGSCNGIVCVKTGLDDLGRKLSLWNPATREHRTLPISTLPRPTHACLSLDTFGFGFDPKTNDYKVVKIINLRKPKSYSYPQVEVYNLSTDSWRKIDAPSLTNLQRVYSSTYLRGFIYWCALPTEDENTKLILSFDVGNEVFEKISPPPDLGNPNILSLRFVNESIALIAQKKMAKNIFEVWVMNNVDSFEKTWTKILIFEDPYITRILGFSRSGKVIVKHFCGHLFLYEPSARRWKVLKYCCLKYPDPYYMGWGQAKNYVESLVSVRRGNQLSEEECESSSQILDPNPIYSKRPRKFLSTFKYSYTTVVKKMASLMDKILH